VINNVEILNGIAKNMSGQISRLATNFWPGLLTILLQPNPALAWDLGDSGALGEFAVRIPNSKILEALTKAIGPLVIASAANSGAGAARRIDEVSALIGEINLYVDGGELPKSELSTVIRFRAEALPEFEIVRLGAISLEKLQEIIPNISLANPS
jgi:tRNA A37 threonylcarbamoyladenosine synthetase subunit TsaC/SUA5/YrdC